LRGLLMSWRDVVLVFCFLGSGLFVFLFWFGFFSFSGLRFVASARPRGRIGDT